jgi:hypothetical protein
MEHDDDRDPRAVRNRRINAFATILLSLAALATSWAGYQASLWSGDQAAHGATSAAIRTRATRVADSAGQLRLIDVGVYVNWAEAYSRNDYRLAKFLEERFRPEFRVAFTRWIAMEPFKSDTAARTPFTLPEYRLGAQRTADSLEALANSEGAASQHANNVSDAYVLDAVILATVMFFATAAQQGRGDHASLRILMLAIALIACSAGIYRIIISPVG